MNIESNGQTEYRVIVVGTAKADLFHQDWMEKGKGAEFLEIMGKLSSRLTKNPRGFGEALYRLPAMQCMVFQGIMGPLVATYAVHDVLPIVFVHVVKLLPGPDS